MEHARKKTRDDKRVADMLQFPFNLGPMPKLSRKCLEKMFPLRPSLRTLQTLRRSHATGKSVDSRLSLQFLGFCVTSTHLLHRYPVYDQRTLWQRPWSMDIHASIDKRRALSRFVRCDVAVSMS